MWQIITAELKYNKWVVIAFIVALPVYTFLSLNNARIIDSNRILDQDIWGSMFSLILYLFYLSVWFRQNKEKRMQFLQKFPVPKSKIKHSNTIILSAPIIISVLYMFIVQIILLDTWITETFGIIIQTGFVAIVFFSFLICRDVWYSGLAKHRVRRTVVVFILAMFFIVVLVGMVFSFPVIYKTYRGLLGESIYYSSKILFFIWWLLLIFISYISYNYRTNYLHQ